jgi:hypothetical protein
MAGFVLSLALMSGFLLRFAAKNRFCLLAKVVICVGMQCLIPLQRANALTATIYGQPLNQAVLQGSNATLAVIAGIPPLSYQWRFNGGNVAGATNSAFTITNVQPANTGAYSVVISNSSGALTSSPAKLYLATAPDFLWARQVTNGIAPNFAAISDARHVAADSSGNVFVAGTFYGASPATIDFGGVALTNIPTGNSPTAFVCKFDRFGNIGWAKLVATNLNSGWPLRLAADSMGNVYFAGRFSGIGTFGTNTLVSSGAGNIFLAKYDSQGNALWARQIVAYDPSSLLTLALAIDLNANVFVSSRYTNVATVGGMSITNSSSFLAKYDSAGNLAWARPCLAAEAIAMAATGSIYITGSVLAPSATPGLLAEYDSAGNLVWSRPFPHGQNIAVDVSENIYVTGSGGGTYGDITITNVNGIPDFFIARCDNAGQLKWFRQTGCTNQPFGTGVALDAFGNIYATAASASRMTEAIMKLGPSTLSNTYSFLIKCDAAGNALWAAAPGGTNVATPWGMTLVDHHEIYLAGKFMSSASFGQFNLLDSNPTGSGAFYLAKIAADTTAAVTLGSPRIVATGTQVQFSVAGVPGYKYAVEGSTNLINWTPILTNASPFNFSETISSAGTQRFYRSAYRP